MYGQCNTFQDFKNTVFSIIVMFIFLERIFFFFLMTESLILPSDDNLGDKKQKMTETDEKG